MQIKGINLCDFCFEPVAQGMVCPKCGLSHENYQSDAGLLPPGSNLIGKYIIGRVLGRGGFGATYMAYSSALGRAVAIKEYMPVGIAYRGKGEECVTIVSEEKKDIFEKGAKRFFDEAKTISRFNKNKNIVSVYEFFYANDTVYYSMEYLDGFDFKKYITKNGGRLNVDEVIRIMKSVCNALIIVHSTQILHRDISPDNIYICKDGEVRLIDFGAAKQVISDEQQNYSVVVKQGFAPSEQYTSKGKQGVWTDIYALGATMYYALMGKVPPDAIDRVENPELEFDYSLKNAAELFKIISKCMETRISDRYQSVIELQADLESIETFDNADVPFKLQSENELTVTTAVENGAFSQDKTPPATVALKENANNAEKKPAKKKSVEKSSKQAVANKTQMPKAKAVKAKPSVLADKGKMIAICASVVILVAGISTFAVIKSNSGKGGGGDGGSSTGEVFATINPESGDVSIVFNGTKVGLQHQAVNHQNAYMVSENDIFSMFGANFTNDGSVIKFAYNGYDYSLDYAAMQISKKSIADANVNETKKFTVAPIKNESGILMLPLQETARFLGANVSYNIALNTIEISTAASGQTAAPEEVVPEATPTPDEERDEQTTATAKPKSTPKPTAKPKATQKPATQQQSKPSTQQQSKPAAQQQAPAHTPKPAPAATPKPTPAPTPKPAPVVTPPPQQPANDAPSITIDFD